MAEPGAHQIDPLEGEEPRPPTFTQRRVLGAIGALAIVVAAGILVLALGRGATPTSARDELGAARAAKSRPAAPVRPGE